MTDWDRVAEKQQVVDVVQAAATAAADGDPLFGFVATYGDPEGGSGEWPDRLHVVGPIEPGEGRLTAFANSGTVTDSYTIRTGIYVRQQGATPKECDVIAMKALRAIAGLLFAAPRLNRAPNAMPDVIIAPARIDGPNGSRLDGTTSESLVLLDVTISRGRAA